MRDSLAGIIFEFSTGITIGDHAVLSAKQLMIAKRSGKQTGGTGSGHFLTE